MKTRTNIISMPSIRCSIRQWLTLTVTLQAIMAIGQTPPRPTDPFRPFIDQVPKVIRVISTDTLQMQDAEDAEVKTVESGFLAKTPVILQQLVFDSRNGQNKVYALLAKPLNCLEQRAKLPALLCLHGGGSKAEDLRSMVLSYAAKGYVALAPDLPGICNPAKAVHSSGPWKNRPTGEAPRFDIENGLDNSILVDAEVAGLEAFNLLRSQSQVDKNKMGITGFSWGGYSTTFLSGLLGKRVKAAYAVFGCGFYEKGSFWTGILQKMPAILQNRWLSYLDAGRRAKNIRAAYFIEAASNDTYFWPEAVSATLGQIKSSANHVWNPNLNHRQGPDGQLMQSLFFAYYLKGKGEAFGQVNITKVQPTNNGGQIITAEVKLPALVQADSVGLYYSLQNTDWQHRNWVEIPMKRKTGGSQRHPQFSAELPPGLAQKNINYFVRLKDKRKVVVASQMY